MAILDLLIMFTSRQELNFLLYEKLWPSWIY